MGILRSLFVKPLTSEELKQQLAKASRERKRKMLELRKMRRKRDKIIDEVRQARKANDNFEVDLLWEEIRQLKFDIYHAKREAKVANLEEIALKRYTRAMEKFERAKDTESIKKLFAKIRSSNLEDKLQEQKIREQEYLDELNAIVQLAEDELYEEEVEEDREKASFLKEIDRIIEAEEKGKAEDAEKHRRALEERLEAEPEA